MMVHFGKVISFLLLCQQLNSFQRHRFRSGRISDLQCSIRNFQESSLCRNQQLKDHPQEQPYTRIVSQTIGIIFLLIASFSPMAAKADGLLFPNSFTVAATLKIPLQLEKSVEESVREIYKKQSKGWELARQKRTVAIKSLEQKGIVTVETDEIGNQFLSLPWIPDRKIPYKSLSIKQRLINEVCAGAFGEISKDVLLHSVDTAKTRRQAKKKLSISNNGSNSAEIELSQQSNQSFIASSIFNIRNLYAGFPIVLITSIPQGGMFFLVKKGVIEYFNIYAPDLPYFVASAIPIGLGVMAYWLFRTPAEVIKTQVQTGQLPSVVEAIAAAKEKYSNGLWGLWKHYTVMLSLDIPFQIMNFILYGVLSEAVSGAGIAPSIWTRLFCGASCGMVSAAATCPLDVCKTRIISRDRQTDDAVAPENSPSIEKPIVQGAIDNVDIDYRTSPILNAANEASSEIAVESDGSLLVVAPRKLTTASSALTTEADSQFLSPTSEEKKTRNNNNNMLVELLTILKEEGPLTLFLGFQQRLVYVGLANGIRLAAYGTSRMDLMMRSLDSI